MPFKAVNDRILVEVVPESDLSIVSAGGIHLDKSGTIKQQWAKAVSVGEGRIQPDGSRGPMPCKVGDKVLLTNPVGIPVLVQGKEFVVIRDTDVLGVVEKD